MARVRQLEALHGPSQLYWKEMLYGPDCHELPTLEDLQRLAQENVDVLVLPQRFDGWFEATDGQWFIYEAAKLNSTSALLESSRRDRASSVQ